MKTTYRIFKLTERSDGVLDQESVHLFESADPDEVIEKYENLVKSKKSFYDVYTIVEYRFNPKRGTFRTREIVLEDLERVSR